MTDDHPSPKSATATVTISLADANDAPSIGGGSFTVRENSPAGTVVGSVSAADPDAGDTLQFSIVSQAINWLSVDATTGQLAVAENANIDFEGNSQNSLTVRVTDGAGLSDETQVIVNATDVNDPPTLVEPIADKTIDVGVLFSFTVPGGTFTDQDSGDSIRYVMTTAAGFSLPAWLSFDAATNTLSGTPTGANVGTLSVKLTALDQLNASSSDVFDINVEIPPAPWHNRQLIEDVNQDSFVTPIDALMVINYLNSGNSSQVPTGVEPTNGLIDVNGDNFVTPIDALIIINRLNRGNGEGESQRLGMDGGVDLSFLDDQIGSKKRKSDDLLWLLAADRPTSE